MSIYKVIIGDSYLSKESVDEIGYYSNYNKAFKALKKSLEDFNQEISFIPVDADKVNGYQGNWVDNTDGYEGTFEIRKIEVE